MPRLLVGAWFDRGRDLDLRLWSVLWSVRRCRTARRIGAILLSLDPPGFLVLLPLHTAHLFLTLFEGFHVFG